jgi:hypothetical protein
VSVVRNVTRSKPLAKKRSAAFALAQSWQANGRLPPMPSLICFGKSPAKAGVLEGAFIDLTLRPMLDGTSLAILALPKARRMALT